MGVLLVFDFLDLFGIFFLISWSGSISFYIMNFLIGLPMCSLKCPTYQSYVGPTQVLKAGFGYRVGNNISVFIETFFHAKSALIVDPDIWLLRGIDQNI